MESGGEIVAGTGVFAEIAVIFNDYPVIASQIDALLCKISHRFYTEKKHRFYAENFCGTSVHTSVRKNSERVPKPDYPSKHSESL